MVNEDSFSEQYRRISFPHYHLIKDEAMQEATFRYGYVGYVHASGNEPTPLEPFGFAKSEGFLEGVKWFYEQLQSGRRW